MYVNDLNLDQTTILSSSKEVYLDQTIQSFHDHIFASQEH